MISSCGRAKDPAGADNNIGVNHTGEQPHIYNPSSLAMDFSRQPYQTQIALINERLDTMSERFVKLETMLFSKDVNIFESIKDIYKVLEVLLNNDNVLKDKMENLKETQLKFDLQNIYQRVKARRGSLHKNNDKATEQASKPVGEKIRVLRSETCRKNPISTPATSIHGIYEGSKVTETDSDDDALPLSQLFKMRRSRQSRSIDNPSSHVLSTENSDDGAMIDESLMGDDDYENIESESQPEVENAMRGIGSTYAFAAIGLQAEKSSPTISKSLDSKATKISNTEKRPIGTLPVEDSRCPSLQASIEGGANSIGRSLAEPQEVQADVNNIQNEHIQLHHKDSVDSSELTQPLNLSEEANGQLPENIITDKTLTSMKVPVLPINNNIKVTTESNSSSQLFKVTIHNIPKEILSKVNLKMNQKRAEILNNLSKATYGTTSPVIGESEPKYTTARHAAETMLHDRTLNIRNQAEIFDVNINDDSEDELPDPNPPKDATDIKNNYNSLPGKIEYPSKTESDILPYPYSHLDDDQENLNMTNQAVNNGIRAVERNAVEKAFQSSKNSPAKDGNKYNNENSNHLIPQKVEQLSNITSRDTPTKSVSRIRESNVCRRKMPIELSTTDTEKSLLNNNAIADLTKDIKMKLVMNFKYYLESKGINVRSIPDFEDKLYRHFTNLILKTHSPSHIRFSREKGESSKSEKKSNNLEIDIDENLIIEFIKLQQKEMKLNEDTSIITPLGFDLLNQNSNHEDSSILVHHDLNKENQRSSQQYSSKTNNVTFSDSNITGAKNKENKSINPSLGHQTEKRRFSYTNSSNKPNAESSDIDSSGEYEAEIMKELKERNIDVGNLVGTDNDHQKHFVVTMPPQSKNQELSRNGGVDNKSIEEDDGYDVLGIYNSLGVDVKRTGINPTQSTEHVKSTERAEFALPAIFTEPIIRPIDLIAPKENINISQDTIKSKLEMIGDVTFNNNVMWTKRLPHRAVTMQIYLRIRYLRALSGSNLPVPDVEMDLEQEIVNESLDIILSLKNVIMTKAYFKSLTFFFCDFMQKYVMIQNGYRLSAAYISSWKKEKSLVLLVMFWRDISRYLRNMPNFTLLQALLELENYRIYSKTKTSSLQKRPYLVKQYLTSIASSSRTASWMYPLDTDLPVLGKKGVTRENVIHLLEEFLQLPTTHSHPKYTDVSTRLTTSNDDLPLL